MMIGNYAWQEMPGESCFETIALHPADMLVIVNNPQKVIGYASEEQTYGVVRPDGGYVSELCVECESQGPVILDSR